VPGTRLLAAYAPQAAAVIGQMRVEATTNEHKAALRLLGVLPPLAGAVVTADAMFTHRDFCEQVLDRQADCVLYAKDNQEQLQQDIRATFAAAESGGCSPPGNSGGGVRTYKRSRPEPRGMAGSRRGRRPPA
jgi:hypothetical protein